MVEREGDFKFIQIVQLFLFFLIAQKLGTLDQRGHIFLFLFSELKGGGSWTRHWSSVEDQHQNKINSFFRAHF